MKISELSVKERIRVNDDCRYKYYHEVLKPTLMKRKGPEVLREIYLGTEEETIEKLLETCDRNTIKALGVLTAGGGVSDWGISLCWRLWEKGILPGFSPMQTNRIVATVALHMYSPQPGAMEPPTLVDLYWRGRQYAAGRDIAPNMPGLERAVSGLRVYEKNTFWIWVFDNASYLRD